MAVKPLVGVLCVTWIALVNIAAFGINEKSFLSRTFGFNGYLAVSNRESGVSPEQKPEQYFAWDILDAENMITGYLVGPVPVLTYRILVLIFFACTLLYQDRLGTGFYPEWPTLLSHWNFITMAVYAILGIGVSIKGMITGAATWGILEKLFLGTFVSACTTGIFLTVFFWAVTYNPYEKCDEDLCYHGVNVLMMLGEIFVSAVPLCSYHLQIVMHYSSTYAVFGVLYFAICRKWVYDALSWEKYEHLIYYFLLPILLTGSFSIMYWLAVFREWTFGVSNVLDKSPLFEAMLANSCPNS